MDKEKQVHHVPRRTGGGVKGSVFGPLVNYDGEQRTVGRDKRLMQRGLQMHHGDKGKSKGVMEKNKKHH